MFAEMQRERDQSSSLLQRRRGTALGAVDEEDIINLNNIQKSNL